MRTRDVADILDQVNGITTRVGVITSTAGGAKTNSANDGTNFSLVPGQRYVMQCTESDLAFTPTPLLTTPTDILPVTADPTKDLIIPAGTPFMFCLRATQEVYGTPQNTISVASTTGTTPFHARIMLCV